MTNEFIKRILSSLILVPIVLFFILKGSIYFIFFLSIFFFLACSEWIKMVKKNDIKFLGLLFIALSTLSAFYFRTNSLDFFLLTILICVSTDIGGYLFGKLLKGPKLTKISPRKTYSGVIGGFLLAIIFSYIFIELFNSNTLNKIIDDNTFLISIMLISCVSQIGDLIISFFKRTSKLKDTGNILPGHGGLLDRTDGMIFAIPFTFMFIKLL